VNLKKFSTTIVIENFFKFTDKGKSIENQVDMCRRNVNLKLRVNSSKLFNSFF